MLSVCVCLCVCKCVYVCVCVHVHACKALINFSKLYREKLNSKNLLILVSPEGPLWMSLIGRKFCNFAYCRSLENVISNKN